MFCTNCGKPIDEGQKFCTGCGAPVPGADTTLSPAADTTPAPAAVTTPSPAVATAQPAPKKPAKAKAKVEKPAKAKKSKAGLIVGIVALLLLIAAFLAFYFVVLEGDFSNFSRLTEYNSVFPGQGSRTDEDRDADEDKDTDEEQDDEDESQAADDDREPEESAAAPAYDFTQLVGVYYCGEEPNSTLEFSVVGDLLSVSKTASGVADVLTVIDPPDGPSFSVDYNGRTIRFFYSAASEPRSVAVTEGSSRLVFTEDGNLSWDPNAMGAIPSADDPFSDPDGYILPTDSRYITEDELYGLTAEQVRLARNEIYARHGYTFNTQSIRDYFLSKNWYHPNASVTASTFGTGQMNDYERANVDVIKGYENRMGW